MCRPTSCPVYWQNVQMIWFLVGKICPLTDFVLLTIPTVIHLETIETAECRAHGWSNVRGYVRVSEQARVCLVRSSFRSCLLYVERHAQQTCAARTAVRRSPRLSHRYGRTKQLSPTTTAAAATDLRKYGAWFNRPKNDLINSHRNDYLRER